MLLNEHSESLSKIQKITSSEVVSPDQKTNLAITHIDKFGVTFGTAEVLNAVKGTSSQKDFMQNQNFQARIRKIKEIRCEKESGQDCYDIGKYFIKDDNARIGYFTKACKAGYKNGCSEKKNIQSMQKAEAEKAAAEQKRKAEEEKRLAEEAKRQAEKDKQRQYSEKGSETECRFVCKKNYSWDGTECIAHSQTANCQSKPANSVWNDDGANGTFTQTWDGEKWVPESIEATYSNEYPQTCAFRCEEKFYWDDETCKKPRHAREHVPDFRQMPSGTAFQRSRNTGTWKAGNQARL